MKLSCTRCLFLLLFLSLFNVLRAQQGPNLNYLDTYYTGAFDEGAAEAISYDPDSKRLYFTNAQRNALTVLTVQSDGHLELFLDIDLDPYGGIVNSVDVANGLVAVAVQAVTKTDPGHCILFDTDGVYLATYAVGALPDMVTFTPDGLKIITADEGEPNDDYTVDPEGSISVIDLTGGVDSATVTILDFQAWNDKKAYLTNQGIRIFGPNATVAQDLEPEYVAVSADGNTAYVTLQENSAVAVVDLQELIIRDLLPLGFKDHNSGHPTLTEFYLNDLPEWPILGAPVYASDQPISLGGFSALFYDEKASSSDEMVFYTIPDRGPNEDAIATDAGSLRPFKLPDYQSRIVIIRVNRLTGEVVVNPEEQIFLTQKDGITPISGRGNIPGLDEIPVTRTDDSMYTSTDYTVGEVTYHQLEFDPFGGDFEGIVRDSSGNFWMCDENRPAIYHVDANGTLIERYVPEGTASFGDVPQEAGYYGAETLPAVYAKRRSNRGFEAIALDTDENIIYAFIQSPIENPDNSVRNKTDVIRILGINPDNGQPVREFVYLLERNRESGLGLSRVDKIGDAFYAGNGKFLVLERDSGTPEQGPVSKKYIFEIDTRTATNLLGTELSLKTSSTGPDDKTLEMMTADDLANAGVRPVWKRKVLNLPSIGYLPSDKSEGVSLLPDGTIVVLNDNDFGLNGAGVSDVTSLGLIAFDSNYGMDASDRDDAINIVSHPTLGSFMPDAIATYKVDGAPYFITVNEGDSRDYDGYSEEERVKDLTLDPIAFPNATELQADDNIGRLKTTSATGDLDGDGDFDRIISYGARSFTIWDQYGNLVYDSGNAIEQITAEWLPDDFNSTNDENDSKDSRSDDKGPEPEALTIAYHGDTIYALVGLERIGGVMIFDITDPTSPAFINYANHRDFAIVDATAPEAGDLGPEYVLYIPGDQSPTGHELVVVSNEVSGTVSLFGLADSTSTRRSYLEEPLAGFRMYPNPSSSSSLHLEFQSLQALPATMNVFNALGQKQWSQTAQIQAGYNHLLLGIGHANLPEGFYFVEIRTSSRLLHSAKLLIKN